MSRLVVVATVRDVAGGLERLLGLLRRRALPVDALSVYRTDPDLLEVAVRFGPLTTPEERVEAELTQLVDLVALRRVDGSASASAREVALATTRGAVGAWPESLIPVVRDETASVIELAGSPQDINRALEFMTDLGVLIGATRSGEIYPPNRSSYTEDPSGGEKTDGPRNQ